MSEFRRVTDDFWVSPQLTPEAVAEAAERGFVLIVNNRPDGEEPGQPSGAQIAEAARAAGLDYAAVPVRGRPEPAQVDAFADLLARAEGPVLAYCRSGMRSTASWALARAAAGADRADLLARARDAGYDLSSVL